MKKIISGFVVVFVLVFMIALDVGLAGVVWLWNAPSLVLVILVAIPMLVIADCFGDYIRSYKILSGNTQFTTKELESSLNAVQLMIRLVFVSAVIGSIIGVILILGSLSDLNALGPAIAVAILTIFYAFLINMFHYALVGKIKKEIIYRG